MTELHTSESTEPGGAEAPVGLPARAGTLHLWLIEPSAAPSDSRWQDRPIWRMVVVAAPSATFARLVAEAWATPRDAPQIGNESPSLRAGFTDEKLYRVQPAPPDFDPEPALSELPGRVLAADLLREAPELP